MNDLTLYYEVRDQIRTGDHLGFASNKALGETIRLFGGTINHSAMAIRLQFEGCEKRRFTMEALGDGFNMHGLSAQLQEYDGNVWWWPLKPEFEHLRSRIGGEAFKMIGIGYDFLGLGMNAFGHVDEDEKRLFCSEAYCLALRRAGVPVPFPEGKAPRPSDIETWDIFLPKVQILKVEKDPFEDMEDR